MPPNYHTEPPLADPDRAKAKASAAKFRYQTQYALTLLCEGPEDQARLHAALLKRYPSRRVRVVVS